MNGSATRGTSPTVARRLSPDGARAAIPIIDSERGLSDIWIFDLAAGRRRRLTVDSHDHPGCCWNADGSAVFVLSRIQGRRLSRIQLMPLDGAEPRTVLETATWAWPMTASRDGRFLVYRDDADDDPATVGLYGLPLSGGSRPFPW